MVFESELCPPRVEPRWVVAKAGLPSLPIPLNAGIGCAGGARPGWYLRFVRRTVPRGQTISPQALVPTAEVPPPVRHLGGAAAEDGSASGPPATTPPAVTAESGPPQD